MTELVEALTGFMNATKNAGFYSIVALLILSIIGWIVYMITNKPDRGR